MLFSNMWRPRVTAIAVVSLLASACSYPGIRVRDISTPTIRSNWGNAGVVDNRREFSELFCANLSQTKHSPPNYCDKWLWNMSGSGTLSTKHLDPPRNASSRASSKTIIIIPGIFSECVAPWVTPFSADYADLRSQGHQIYVVPVSGRGSSLLNASIIQEKFEDLGDIASGAIVIAYSKGASDFMLAASRLESVSWRNRVSAFVSIAGTAGGSPIANHGSTAYRRLARKAPFRACSPQDGGGVQSLTYTEARNVADAFLENHPPFPSYSIAAVADDIPVTPFLRPFHSLLSRIDERNDGQVLLEDAVIPRSTVLGIFRADHWSIALPFAESTATEMKPLGINNDFPRGALIQSIVDYLDSPPLP